MKRYNKILEAVNRGIQFALDDFDPEEAELSKPKQKTITKEDSLYNNLLLRDYVVDLGLPSGTLWCKYNLGCDFDLLNNNPKQTKSTDWYGDYYAWGETENKLKQGKDYNWITYKYCNTNEHNLTKYCNSYANGNRSYTDILTQLQQEDDAAYQNMNKKFKFHIPTREQFLELKEYTTKQQVNDFNPYNKKIIKGLNGMIFKSIINENEIFFPSAGDTNSLRYADFGEYWTSTLYNTASQKAWALYIKYNNELGKLCYLHASERSIGHSIRPVIN